MPIPSSRPTPVALSRTQLWLARGGIAFFLILFALGLVGITILMDENRGNRLSQTRAADLYRNVISVNPLFAGLLVNGGLLGMLFCYTKIRDHFEVMSKQGGEATGDEPRSGKKEDGARPSGVEKKEGGTQKPAEEKKKQ